MSGVRLRARVLSEFVGTLFLLATVVGSGIMGARLAGGNVGIALLANAIATGAALYVLIQAFGAISGAHFNPVVTATMLARGEISRVHASLYLAAQVAGGIAGVALAHGMFDLSIIQISTTIRSSTGQFISEVVATAGLVLVILSVRRHRPEAIAAAVALYIVAAYWFTASTSFANPAVTLARSLTDTFAGIRPADVLSFVLAQAAGGAVGIATDRALNGR